MSYPMPRAIAGAAEATRARPMIDATLINVVTMSSSHAPASNARAIALRTECFGGPERHDRADTDERVGLGLERGESSVAIAQCRGQARRRRSRTDRAGAVCVPRRTSRNDEAHLSCRRFERIRSTPATSRWHEIGGAGRPTSRAARSRGAARSLRRAKRHPASDRSRSPGTSPCSARGGAVRRPAGT